MAAGAGLWCAKWGGHYDEARDAPNRLSTETLKLEESRFRKTTLDRGLEAAGGGDKRVSSGGEALAGDVAFKLYDTYGFPLDLTQDVLRGEGRGVGIVEAAFETLPWNAQRAEARQAPGPGPARRRPRAVWFGCA